MNGDLAELAGIGALTQRAQSHVDGNRPLAADGCRCGSSTRCCWRGDKQSCYWDERYYRQSW